MSNSSSSSRPVRTSKGTTTMSKPINGITAFRNLQTRQKRFVIALVSICGTPDATCGYTRAEVLRASTKCGMCGAPVWVTNDESRRLGRGIYFIPEVAGVAANVGESVAKQSTPSPKPKPSVVVAAVTEATDAPRAVAALVTEVQNFIPSTNSIYVPWGNFSTLRAIIKSKVFFPVWINGLSGNGKTVMVEQVCAKENREMFRVNITEETDEDDLLGGFRLVNGDTVWQDGPVVQAMNRGAVLLLDEIDLGSFKIMCLQPVLEGKGVYLKKIGRLVTPAKGFTVVGTANTKGKGCDTGTFVGTRIQNEAMLERFKVTIDQEYPPMATETTILNRAFDALGVAEEVYKPIAETLAKWADILRAGYARGIHDDVITTRRLCGIAEGYAIFGDIEKTMELSLSRFPAAVRESWLDTYKKLVEVTEHSNGTATAAASKDPTTAPWMNT